MNKESLGELYMSWLYRQVAPIRLKNPALTYWSLLQAMHTKEFTWFVRNDDNRAEDGRYLRFDFLDSIHEDPEMHADFLCLDCSMLEMLIALAKRLSYSGGGASRKWFWHMIENLGIRFVDEGFTAAEFQAVDEALERVKQRTYAPDGTGGLFPLRRPNGDQRRVELWYQMGHYLVERG